MYWKDRLFVVRCRFALDSEDLDWRKKRSCSCSMRCSGGEEWLILKVVVPE